MNCVILITNVALNRASTDTAVGVKFSDVARALRELPISLSDRYIYIILAILGNTPSGFDASNG